MAIKSILIFSNSRTALDLDLKMPIALGFRNKGYPVTFFLMNIYSFETVFTKKLELIATYRNYNIIYRDDLYPFKSFVKIYKLYKQFSGIYIDTIIRRILQLLAYILNTFMFNIYVDSISKICDRFDIIIASNYPGIPIDKLEACFYNKARLSKALFIGTPLVVWPHWYQKIIYPFDLFLTSSKTEFQEIFNSNAHPNVKFLGCPSLEVDYLDDIVLPESCRFKHNNMIILFIMVNSNNPIYKDFKIIEESKKIISDLILNGYKVILKYHPNDCRNYFDDLLITNSDFFEISDISIEILAKKVDFVITFLSTSILKTIALQKPSFLFLPNSFLKSFERQDEYFKSVYFTDSSLSKTWIDDYCNKFSNINEFIDLLSKESNYSKMYNDFLDCFLPVKSSERIVNFLSSEINNQFKNSES